MNVGPFRLQDSWDGMQLRRWRQQHGVSMRALARRVGKSATVLYHYENGRLPPLHIAHKIVATTRGAIRYRDIYVDFRPEYA